MKPYTLPYILKSVPLPSHTLPNLLETAHTDLHKQKSCRGTLLLQHTVGAEYNSWEDLIPTCFEFQPHLFSAMLVERLFCFPGLPATWRVLLLWICFCICLPAQVQGALVVSHRDALTQVFKINYMCSTCL